ncbi:helix-turn-helix domain-containing protein [Pseudoduganella violaceinigra]|uniref:helix-turn-helix domain-containing protein n=1 Tax=Pseudoduganella violaceinigra TaxID=246602 RepID=UPI000403E88D|nr:helix-turn-helix domain-containing protein [Pseudoduganella violaceinigra]
MPVHVGPDVAALYLEVSEQTLAIWRCTKRYPLPYIKVGRLVRYRLSDLEAFLVLRTIEASYNK